MASPNSELASLLTPAILHEVLKNRLPWSMYQPLDGKEVHAYIFQADEGPQQEQLREICWPALLALSKLGVDNVPDMMQFLPPPESQDFPVQALGLQLLLDQAPRALCDGMDARYIMDYFQIVSRRYAQQLLDLPSDLRIDRKKRWVEEQGASFDYWLLTRLWLIAPLIHHESLKDHEFAEIMTEEVRVEVEKATGKTDPYRAKREELMQDLLAFPRMYNEGPSSENGLPMEGFAFWMWTVLDVHKPIIERFGWYPYSGASRGRESTDEERQYSIDFFDGVDRSKTEVAQRLRDDVKIGRWTPLGADLKA